MGHFYFENGTPCYEVPYRDPKKGMRATNLSDARKLNLKPSVTTIMQVLDKPGLQIWLQDRVLESALTMSRKENEPDKAFIARIKKDSKEISEQAMNVGSEIHDAIEHAFKGDSLDKKWRTVAEKVRKEIINRYGVNWDVEKSFATDTYGGKIDLSRHNFIIDYKTKEKFKTNKCGVPINMAFDEHLMQLVAYGQGLGYELLETKYINVFVSWEGDIQFHEWEDVDEIIRANKMFQACLKLWQLKNKFNV